MSEDLILDVSSKVATITLNRPHRKNAFTFEMIDEWAAALEECRRNDAIQAIVVTGNGDGFCSGLDIEIMKGRVHSSPEQRKNELWKGVQRIPLLLEDIDKPVIAAVNGDAIGAGMDLSLMCDVRFAAATARFSETYVKMGLVPGAGGAYFLTRLVGPAKALELFWSAAFLSADEAERLGIVNRVLPKEDLLAYVQQFAERVASAPPHSVRVIKRLVYQGLRADLRTNLDSVSSHYVLATAAPEHHKAIQDFIERERKRG